MRFDSALRLDPHGHVLASDGVWVRDEDGASIFHALAEPTAAEFAELAERTAARIERVFEAHGKSFEDPCDDSEQLWLEPRVRCARSAPLRARPAPPTARQRCPERK
jgi:hypothetical protein